MAPCVVSAAACALVSVSKTAGTIDLNESIFPPTGARQFTTSVAIRREGLRSKPWSRCMISSPEHLGQLHTNPSRAPWHSFESVCNSITWTCWASWQDDWRDLLMGRGPQHDSQKHILGVYDSCSVQGRAKTIYFKYNYAKLVSVASRGLCSWRSYKSSLMTRTVTTIKNHFHKQFDNEWCLNGQNNFSLSYLSVQVIQQCKTALGVVLFLPFCLNKKTYLQWMLWPSKILVEENGFKTFYCYKTDISLSQTMYILISFVFISFLFLV